MREYGRCRLVDEVHVVLVNEGDGILRVRKRLRFRYVDFWAVGISSCMRRLMLC